jgi:hypothetical protein
MVIWTMSCSTLSVMEVGTSTSRQISGSVSSSSTLTVQIWLKLSAAAVPLGGGLSAGSCFQVGSLFRAVPGRKLVEPRRRVIGDVA